MSGRFQVFLADPAWSYDDRHPRGGAEHHYSTMSIDRVKALPIERLSAPDAALFLWGTYPLLQEMLDTGRAWGFTYKTIAFQWVKHYPKSGKPFFGLGHWTRGNTEGCFLFTRGKPKRIDAGVSQLIEDMETEQLNASLGRHSAKPPEVRDRIVRLMGDVPRLELFAREHTPGWHAWGNELPPLQIPDSSSAA